MQFGETSTSSTSEHLTIVIDKQELEKKEKIEMENISGSILDVAKRQFVHLFPFTDNSIEIVFTQLQQSHYLPKQLEKESAFNKDVLRLCYLTTITGDIIKSPFTAKDVKIFKKSKEKADYTVGWFKKGIVPFLLLSTVVYVSLLTVNENNYWKTSIAATAGFISTFALQLLSLCITGTNPNSSKDADNLKQNTIQKVKGTYDEMANELVVLNNAQPRFAKYLAEQIDLKKMFTAAVNSHLKDVEAKTIFKFLKDAVLFVRGDRMLPRHHDLRLYLRQQ